MNPFKQLSLLATAVIILNTQALQAADYLKPNSASAASIQLNNLLLTDVQGNNFYKTVALKASDNLDLHVGQKYNVEQLNDSTADATATIDAMYSASSNTLVLAKLLQNAQPAFNVALVLTKEEPIELTVTGLGLYGPASSPTSGSAGLAGPKGDAGPKGADGLTTSVNGIEQINGKITLSKADLGLGNVDNTSDTNKPISTATLNALNLKAPSASPGLTGVPTAPTAAPGSNSAQIATTAFVNNALANANVTHYVGELFGGGIVIYVYKIAGIEHALIASLADLPASGSTNWGSSSMIGPKAQSFSNGIANTAAIAASTAGAARICTEYRGGGFSDWYLPSINELTILFNQSFVVNTVTINDNDDSSFGLRNSSSYWSSTEYTGVNEAWFKNFADGYQNHMSKNQQLVVRAFRQI